ncbi:hypothetical protein COY52_12175 [Candidatus Desantisbacteria bacterium CG_4_10_14_0_8_um_filter_48_22]|uniref:DUF5618 domain-containing protein n=1 Tax=Candidatus Desantisbacteria bacterium CG_4_10_14_0_8_um_filter_48_22 TaxID=1974543 RepID=A0A2M7S4N6_9BACT|nr:MAG: hypothetical protein AUJ67_09615 [Candidatus Desantisbacteria bacterium CG1_02_49_89]PIZ14535.1 MAG: hypothetical protein COY52_12175 [Candidatus Desantisbacteria bacterium CG_4_10_14_0_8_um_filter_48_22]
MISKRIYMGNFKKHLALAKEKLQATVTAYQNKQHTVVGDLATKVVEQLVEAEAAKKNQHFGTHKERHEYCNKNFPPEINESMRKVWFAYGDLGYDGVNGKRARTVMENLKSVVTFFKERLDEKIEPEINI